MKSDLLTVSLNKVQINGNYARCFITSAVDKFWEVEYSLLGISPASKDYILHSKHGESLQTTKILGS
jgi:hypothetical protein